MMPLLIASLQKLDDDNRLDDIETSSAKVLYDIMHYVGRSLPNSYTAYGISKLFHGDIDYFYAVYTSGLVKACSIKNLGLLCETGKGVRTLKRANIREEPRETESELEKERAELHETFMELLTYWRAKKLIETELEKTQ